MKYREEDFEVHKAIKNFPYQGVKKFANGWFYSSEGSWYEKQCSYIFNGNIIEIGSYEGLSLSYIKDTIKNNKNKIYSVEKQLNKRLVKNCNEWGVNLIQGTSLDSAKIFPDEFFDLIFIDASHFYKDVKEDILTWLPLLKTNGIIAGHDYDSNWMGVVKAVDELLPERKIKDRIWYVKKTKHF
jgi:hypothetical protein